MSQEKRRNVLMIHTDQQRYDSLGCTGGVGARTPNLDRLASEGVLFTRHIVSNTVCMPSRASLLTGRYPSAHGVTTNGVPLPRRDHPATPPAGREKTAHIETLADMLAGAGYRTASVGKLHLTPTLSDADLAYPESGPAWEAGRYDASWTGPYCGFQHVELTRSHGEGACKPSAGHYGHWLATEHPEVLDAIARRSESPRGRVEGIGDLWLSAVPAEAHHSMWLAERAGARIDAFADAGEPWFLFAGFADPHHPFTPPEQVAAAFEDMPVAEPVMSEGELADKPSPMRRLMTDPRRSTRSMSVEAREAMVRHTAASVSLIDRAVGRIIETLKAAGQYERTMIVFTSDHGDWLTDHGLFRKAGYPSHSLLHTPLIVREPGRAAGRIDRAVSNVDVTPTILERLGVSQPVGLQGGNVFEEELLSPMAQCGTVEPAETSLTIYDDRYRYSWYNQLDEEELYDHRADPGELVNLAASLTDETRSVRDRLRARLGEQTAHCWAPPRVKISPW